MISSLPALVQSLSAVRAAMGAALESAVSALAQGADASTHWRSAHAALQVVNHPALVRFSTELGAHFDAADANLAPAAQEGVAALLSYIDRVTGGGGDQPLRLAAAYEALQKKRGAQPAASDLYFPDLTRLPEGQPGAQMLSADELRATRREYESGLLQWLKKGEAVALAQVGDAVSRVEGSCREAVMRRPWWVSRAVIEALLGGGLAPEPLVRRLLTQLNLYLGRLVNAPTEPPEALLRDALYLTARAQAVTPHIEKVRATHSLDGLFDFDAVSAPVPFEPSRLAAARSVLETLITKWTACAGGAASVGEFAQRLQAFTTESDSLGAPALTALIASFAQDAQTLAARGGAVSEPAALEGACALLMLENALAKDTPPEAEFAERAQHMAARLRVSIVAPTDLSPLAPARLLDEASLRQRLEEPTALVHSEIGRALHDVELTLESWFRDPRKPEAIGGLDKPLRQAGGALAILGHTDAAALAAECRSDINRHATGAPCIDGARHSLVARLTALTAFVEGAITGKPDFAAAMRGAGLQGTEPTARADPVTIPGAQPQQQPEAGELALSGLDLVPPVASVVAPPAAAPSEVPIDGGADTDGELLEIFLEEADGVLQTISDTVPKSAANPADGELLTELRRAFHTLKGSGRMVGLSHFGEAAWEMEQIFNEMNSAGRPGTPELYRVVSAAHADFERWVAELRGEKRARIDAKRLASWAAKYRAGESIPQEAVDVVAVEPGAAAVDDNIRVGEVSISRSLYDIVLPEAEGHAVVLMRESASCADGGTVSAEFLRSAHTLGGIMATAGLAPISILARSLERVLQEAVDRGIPIPPQALSSVTQAVTALGEQVRCLALPGAVTAHPDLVAGLDALALTAPVVVETPAAAPTEPAALSATLDFVPEPAVAPDANLALQLVSLSTSGESDGGIDRRQYRLKDDIDPQLLPIFLEEATELVPQVGQDLRDWRARPSDKLIPLSLKRLLHTLKGSSRMAGAMALGQLTHSMETRIENAQLLTSIPPQLLDDLETSFDRIGILIGELRGEEARAVVEPSVATPLPEAIERMAQTQMLATVAGELTQAIPMHTGITPQATGAAPRQLIRVRADLVDRLSSQAGEISITRARVVAELRTARASLRDLGDNINRLRAQLRELEIQAETQMQSRTPDAGAIGEHFDPLEFDRFTRLQELTRLMAESVNDVATVQRNLGRDLDEGEKALASQGQITREVQQDLMAIRMIPFSSLSDRLYRVARLSAKDNMKRVELEIAGGHVEMDRGVIDRVAAPIEHLLRNAIVHGIEAPAARTAAGKPESGALKLTARQEGNEIVLTLADDGAGLNIARIRQKAITLGLMRENERLTEQQIGNFIFRSGFSTAGEVTEDAGRGVGMDVVMSEITSLGGRVGTEFVAGAGTTFTIHLPLTLSVLQAVVLRLGGNYYAVPTTMVEQVQRLKTDVLAATRNAMVVEWQNVIYPFSPLATLLGMEGESTGAAHASVVLLRSGAHRAAIEVDDIVGGQEIVIKNIGTQLARVPGVTGAAVLGSGETVLILNPVLLSLRYAEIAAALQATQSVPAVPVAAAPAEPERQKSVLVVDDSLTVRKITGRLLTREGYIVLVAKDGVEALEKMRDGLPDVMLTDVEMPRMDGFDLTRNVREDERLRSVPIIMITSRTADKHRQHATELGVDVFLGKPYEEGELLRHIAALAKGKVGA